MERLNKNDQRELLKVRFEKDLHSRRELELKGKFDEKQKIQQLRMLEKQRIEQEILKKHEDQAAKRRAHERMIEEEQRAREMMLKQQWANKLEIIKSSSLNTNMRTKKIEQEQLQLVELKKQKLVAKYESKQSALSTLEQEKRAFSTLKRDDLNDRILSVRSRGD